MTDESDPKVSQRYRELGAEEPPRALDEKILAASRRPAPSLSLPARSWTRRWAVPLSLAAVVVLSVTVTMRVQHEQPGIEAPATRPAPAAAPSVAKEPRAEPSLPDRAYAEKVPAKAMAEPAFRTRSARETESAPRKEPVPFQPALRERAPAAVAVPASPAPAEAMRQRTDEARSADSAGSVAGARAPQSRAMQELAKPVAETPEKELDRIANLRRDGRHEEADKALAEFRRRYPDYKVPAEMLERVEKR